MNRNDSAFEKNQERYRQAFSQLQIPEPVSVECLKGKENLVMNKLKSFAISMSAAAVCLLGVTTAYAADLGGVRTTITGWFNQEQTAVDAQPDGDGGYVFTGPDGKVIGGGRGIEYDAFGNEIPLDAEDVYNASFAELLSEENGHYFLISKDRKVDVTELLAQHNPLRVKMTVDGKIRYFIVEAVFEDGRAVSTTFTADDKPIRWTWTKDADYIDLDQ